MSKFSNILTMILVILIVGILGIGGYFVYDALNSKAIDSNAQSAIDEFEQATKNVKRKRNNKNDNKVENQTTDGTNTTASLEELANMLASTNTTENNSSSESSEEPKEKEKAYYEGYEIKGRIQIPATKVDYPILENATRRALEVAVGLVHGPGLNIEGNTTIFGHNYRNGKFFSNNKKLKNGDEILITDQEGETVTYVIYNIFETTENDADYMIRDTNGRREISLQTCTDDSKGRIIVCAAEKGSMEE